MTEGAQQARSTICHDPRMTYPLTGTGIGDVALSYGRPGRGPGGHGGTRELGSPPVWSPDAGEDICGAFDTLLGASEDSPWPAGPQMDAGSGG